MDISFEQLKKIVHGLKISGLSFVDQEALTHIQGLIKYLPSSEQIDSIKDNKVAINNLKNKIGEIMQLIEAYGKRGIEQEKRNISIKKLPPRYKHLEWRENMDKAAQVEIVKGMVKISSTLDQRGNASLAHKALVCAKNLNEDRIDEMEIEGVLKEISAAGYDDLIKEAGPIWDAVKGVGKHMVDKAKGWATQNIVNPAKAGIDAGNQKRADEEKKKQDAEAQRQAAITKAKAAFLGQGNYGFNINKNRLKYIAAIFKSPAQYGLDKQFNPMFSNAIKYLNAIDGFLNALNQEIGANQVPAGSVPATVTAPAPNTAPAPAPAPAANTTP